MEMGISIEGILLMLDNATPHVAVPVQVIHDEKVIATKLSDEAGRYQFTALKSGHYQLRCQVLGGYVYYRSTDKPLRSTPYRSQFTESAIGEMAGEVLQVEAGKTLRNVDFRFAPFKKGVWRHYGPLDGLAHNAVNKIHAAPDGMMWFATDGGYVSRYDGKEFVSFSFGNTAYASYVWGISSEPDGVMWFGTWGDGIYKYEGGNFNRITDPDGRAEYIIRGIHRDSDGTLWFATRGAGVCIYDGGNFRSITTQDGLASDNVNVVCRAPNGTLWFGTWGAGVSRYDDGKFKNFTSRDGLTHNTIRDIHVVPNGNIWFGTDNGISIYDGYQFHQLNEDDGLPSNNRVMSIQHDSEGLIWVGMWYGGIACYDGERFVNYTITDGLSTRVVKDVYIDSDGLIWIATGTSVDSFERGGVSVYDRRTFIDFTTKDGLPSNIVRGVYIAPDGAMWISTAKGVSLYDGKNFINFGLEDGLPHELICSNIRGAPDGKVWFGTGGSSVTGRGAFYHDGKQFVCLTGNHVLDESTVYDIYCASGGILWIGTDHGVFRYDGDNLNHLTVDDGLPSQHIISIQADADGSIWFGTWGGGVSVYDGNSLRNFSSQNSLVSDVVIEVHRTPDDAIWLGMAGGVCRYNGKEFVKLISDPGLLHNSILTIFRDSRNIAWFGTDTKGVFGYDGAACSWIDTRDGLAGDRVTCIQEDENGYIWFATNGGLTRYRPCRIPPKAYIVSVVADQTYTDLSAIPALTLGTRITIEYSSIDFKTLPEKRQYRCRVREIDSDWCIPTKETTFDCVLNKPGEYTFEVQAIDRDLNYSESATLKLTVKTDPVLVSMQTEIEHLREKYRFTGIIGQSNEILRLQALIERAIESGYDVLVTGETGTGKELVARAIHYNSPRKEYPLLDLNCGAVDRELIYSRLFGHRRGSFTGAFEDRSGLFEAASGGTVLLDEIGEMPQNIQPYFLRFLQERKVQRLGEHESIAVDVRIIAMTNRDLLKEVEAGNFREDLYYRLSLFPINVPPLRKHPEDIPLLAEHFLEGISKDVAGFASGVFGMLQSYSWPGNVRELRNAVLLAGTFVQEGEYIQTYHFPAHIAQRDSMLDQSSSGRETLAESVDRFKFRMVEETLKKSGGNRAEAARILGIKRPNLVRLIKRLGIE